MRTVTLIDENMQWATVDNAYLDSMGIQKFLEYVGSWLQMKKMNDGKAFSQWLFDHATAEGIEPIMAMAMLQKEQSLIQKWQFPSIPPASVTDWACGYGAPEGSKPANRDPKYKGLETQIVLMLQSFNKYIKNGDKWPSIKHWQTTPVALYVDGGRKSGEKVLAGTLETALHLLYNPRVDGDGVSLLKTIWDRYYEKAQKLNLIRGDVE